MPILLQPSCSWQHRLRLLRRGIVRSVCFPPAHVGCAAVLLALVASSALLAAEAAPAAGTVSYQDNPALVREVKELVRAHKAVARAELAARTEARNEIWRLELGAGREEDRTNRPALLLVAGIEGNDLAGSAIIMAWVRSLLQAYERKESPARQLLDSTTLYVWPRLNPDGARHFFEKPRRETATDDTPVDDDHDGLIDEDGPEDLDGDGVMTSMRVEDPDGEYILDPAEPRLLIRADKLKGERGAWKLLTEGRDNDGDKNWNEDGPGGVNFNRNFPFNYRFFAPGSGRHPVSQVETRALADFVVAHQNIAVAFTFGAADSLTQTPKGESPKRPPTAIQEADLGWYRELGKGWREEMGLKKDLPAREESGTFSDWMYYHRGRLSLAARPWFPALAVELARGKSKPAGTPAAGEDNPAKAEQRVKEEKPGQNGDAATPVTAVTAGKEPPPPKDREKESDGGKEKDKEKDKDSRNEEERAFLKWVDEKATNSFLPWKRFEHPDFPGRRVEIGGYAPFARSNPPESMLGELAAAQGRFLTGLAGKLPRLAVRKVVVKDLGESVYDITLHVENTGFLPTQLAQGTATREVLPTRVVLQADNKNVLSGTRVVTLGAIEGGEAKEVRWVVRAKGESRLRVRIISALAGRLETTVELKP